MNRAKLRKIYSHSMEANYFMCFLLAFYDTKISDYKSIISKEKSKYILSVNT
jgi:hypothetical protein